MNPSTDGEKPSNIGVKYDCTIKLLDFGLSRKENKFMTTPCRQTLSYRSPEILLNFESYTNIVDIWSIGCIMGEMVTDKILFPGEHTLDQWERIVDLIGSPENEFIDRLSPSIQNYVRKRSCKGMDFKVVFPDSSFLDNNTQLANQARDLLSRMLVINPARRITVDEALKHPYVKIWSKEEDFGTKPRLRKNEFVEKNHESIEEWKTLIYKELALIHKHFDREG